jgi:hypothetical protein
MLLSDAQIIVFWLPVAANALIFAVLPGFLPFWAGHFFISP